MVCLFLTKQIKNKFFSIFLFLKILVSEWSKLDQIGLKTKMYEKMFYIQKVDTRTQQRTGSSKKNNFLTFVVRGSGSPVLTFWVRRGF